MYNIRTLFYIIVLVYVTPMLVELIIGIITFPFELFKKIKNV